ncbi:hypothetical protein [Caudoviricetes sp.]|nr:hypothetical protein [Caudoviricetes sp.]
MKREFVINFTAKNKTIHAARFLVSMGTRELELEITNMNGERCAWVLIKRPAITELIRLLVGVL